MKWKNLNKIKLSICKKVLRFIKFCLNNHKKIGKIDYSLKISKLIFQHLSKIQLLKIFNQTVHNKQFYFFCL